MHDVGGKSNSDRVNKGETANKRKSVCFPTSQSSTGLINDEVVHPFIASISEDGGAKVFAKVSCGGEGKLILNHLNVAGGSARREEDFGF